MPPPGYEPFLRAICADPEDDTVRLVYADWLDENGDPERAEFIRLQIAHSRLPAITFQMAHLENEMWWRNRTTWHAELPCADAVEWSSFIRGFAFGLSITSANDFAKHGAPIFSAAPVTHLTFSGVRPDEMAHFVRVPEIRQVKYMSLHIHRKLNNSWRALTECPHLTNLRSLSILSNPDTPNSRRILTDAEARLLADAPGLPLLNDLSLFGTVSRGAAVKLRGRFKTVTFHL